MQYPRAAWLVALCTACGFDHGVIAGSDGGGSGSNPQIDGAVDAPAIPPDSAHCYGTFVPVCLTATPPADYTVSTATALDTDTDCTQVVTQTSGPALCVVAAQTIHIDAPLQASGSRALVLLATDTLEVGAAGVVDVGSYRDVVGQVTEVVGAGMASGALCGAPTTGGNDDTGGSSGAGGGAGGSFGGAGGNGARGRNSAGGAGGLSVAASTPPTFVRGGCSGTTGGAGNGNAGGKPGAGGGAVLVIAGTSITNAGHIRACGMGGYGGERLSGGGGGGSGGFIGLDAPTVTSTGIVNANGGGGGEGGGTNDAGYTASSGVLGTAGAAGGTGNVNGGDGGGGSFGAAPMGYGGATDANGGGAGGGGAGVIRVFPAQSLGGTVSPPAS
jgi:hypothetical protein